MLEHGKARMAFSACGFSPVRLKADGQCPPYEARKARS
jgi:hypothetical protein